MSSSDIAISINNLSKVYRILTKEKATTVAELIVQQLRGGGGGTKRREVKALSDINFDVKQGEVLGLIGRNGAGKSTLLKILSNITEPTTGRCVLSGRVGTLLEVGAGFHPELTGRENIFLSGSILGMTRGEIKKRFDEIVDFAGTSIYLDTPVKRYSSGMYVRLAFAVAAHLPSEILLVDEVLAVGDIDFQKKCLGKIESVSKDGRTVVLVSHNLQSVAALCTSAVALDGGKILATGSVREVIDAHIKNIRSDATTTAAAQRKGSGEYRFEKFAPSNPIYTSGQGVDFEFRIRKSAELPSSLHIAAGIRDGNGILVAQCDTRPVGCDIPDADMIGGTLSLRSPWLKPGTYTVDVILGVTRQYIDIFPGACMFEIAPQLPYESAIASLVEQGAVLPDFVWTAHAATADAQLANELVPARQFAQCS